MLSVVAVAASCNRHARSLSDSSFVERRRRRGQIRGRRLEQTGGVFAGIRGGLFQAEHDADASRSFAAVEWYDSDRFLVWLCR